MGNHPDIKSPSHVGSLQHQKVSRVGCPSYGQPLGMESQLQILFAAVPGGASRCVAECGLQGTGNLGARVRVLPATIIK